MMRKLFSILMLAVMVVGAPSAAVRTPTAAKSVKPIGALPINGTHLVPPREDVVLSTLQDEGKVPLNATPEEVKAAVEKYNQEWNKKSPEWINPELEAKAIKHEDSLASTGISAQADPAVVPVSVKILALTVDFSDTVDETIDYQVPSGNTCVAAQLTHQSGPRQGHIPAPGARDNNTVWYTNAQTADPDFYKKLIFGTEGVGRVRMDLTDPVDGQPGVNLAGYTVQDYYDHVAGTGNVSLSGEVDGWVTVDHSEAYYGVDDCVTGDHGGGGSVDVAQLAVDTLGKFKTEHPINDPWWKTYDADNDGVVDTFWLIHAGMGQEAGGGAQGDNSIWSHSSDLRYSVGRTLVYQAQNANEKDIVVGPYTMQPENADMGVFAEEFGHNVFGLPDLYTTDVDNSMGFWAIMAGGAWGGPLGGAAPVGMPLWFRMVAYCGDTYCNWQYPMQTIDYNDLKNDVTIGQLENTPAGVNKGVRINLPNIVKTTNNLAGDGNGAWAGMGNEMDKTLDRSIVVPATNNTLSLDTYWDIESGYDYGYVKIQDGDTWSYLSDSNFSADPKGHPGLTGTSAKKTIQLNLSAFAGKTVTLRFEYITDPGVNGKGWWIDNLKIGSTLVEDFGTATGASFGSAWTNSNPGWELVPVTHSNTNYYLVEWRNTTKYDKMAKTAYVTSYSDDDEWQVERVPYNIPGALIYYRNTAYSSSYSLAPYMEDDPSFGSKYQLLIVDMHPGRLAFTSGGKTYKLGTRSTSYDAALTLNDTQAFTLNAVNTADGVMTGPFNFAAKPAVSTFDDYNGYYPGFYYNPAVDPTSLYYWNYPDSAVIPAAGNYSSRVTDIDGNPYTDLYGMDWTPSWLGSGNPGDDQNDYGVMVKLVSQAADGTTATLHFPALTYETTHTWKSDGSGYVLTYSTKFTNDRPRPVMDLEYFLFADQPLDFVSLSLDSGKASPTMPRFTPQNSPVSMYAFRATSIDANSTQTWTLRLKYNGQLPAEINSSLYFGGAYGHEQGGDPNYHGDSLDSTDKIYALMIPFISR
jgi:immune inhibitor A